MCIKIDEKSLSDIENTVIKDALRLYLSVGLGRFSEIKSLFYSIFGSDVVLDEERINEVMDLLTKADAALWKGKRPWSLFDKRKRSKRSLIAAMLIAKIDNKQEKLDMLTEEILQPS